MFGKIPETMLVETKTTRSKIFQKCMENVWYSVQPLCQLGVCAASRKGASLEYTLKRYDRNFARTVFAMLMAMWRVVIFSQEIETDIVIGAQSSIK